MIGNEKYEHATQLRQAPDDARTIAGVLADLGFEVTLRTNVDNRQLHAAVADFEVALRGADVGFFYYAGHGIQVDGTNFLVPVDAVLSDPAYAQAEALPADRLMAAMDADLNVVVLDACRNNPFVRSWSGARSGRSFADRGLDPLPSAPSDRGFLLALATDPGHVALDSGVYASALAKHLREPCANLPLVFARVRDDVAAQTDGIQRPWLNNGAGASAHAFMPAGCSRPVASGEDVAYGIATGSATIEGWEGFLRGFPDGAYATAARAQLAQLVRQRDGDTSIPSVTDPVVGRLRLVPAGTFELGALDGDADERPVRTVSLGAFYLMESEVTQRMWREVTGASPSFFDGCDDCPVEQVSWTDAVAFAEELSRRSGHTYRLPTEAEWEYAARGAALEVYSGSATADPVAWVSTNAGNKTHPACGKQRNGFGLCDMSGNVWEWVADAYAAYPTTPYAPPASGSSRVIRGGAWSIAPNKARVAGRSAAPPGSRLNNLGLRLVRSSL